MSQPYIGEIRMFAGNFPPQGWEWCNGQTLAISENDALFNLIGTTYGGDGQETFQLPNLAGRIPVHSGNGFVLSESGGQEQVTLSTQQLPVHTHLMPVSNNLGSTSSPANAFFAKSSSNTPYTSDTSLLVPIKNTTVSAAGSSQPHSNLQPYLCVSFIISLFGVYPPTP